MSEREEPKFFSVAKISSMLEISQSRTYELVCSDDYPFNVVKVGKRLCIPANSFYKWYESLAGGDNQEMESMQEFEAGGVLNMNNMFNELLTYCYLSVLKPLGWKKEGSNFRQYDNDGLCKIINFQKSKWNTSQECAFYINIGIYIEVAGEIEKKRFYEYECQFRNRAAFKGGIYRLNSEVDLSRFEEQIASIITDEVLVLLNYFDSKENFVKMLLSGEAQRYTDIPVMHYHTCKLLCDMGFKKEILAVLKDKKGRLFEELAAEIQKEIYN